MIEPKTIPLPEVYPAHPRDETLEAFKEWLEAITGRIKGSSEENQSISKNEWIYLWKDFWAKRKAAVPSWPLQAQGAVLTHRALRMKNFENGLTR